MGSAFFLEHLGRTSIERKSRMPQIPSITGSPPHGTGGQVRFTTKGTKGEALKIHQLIYEPEYFVPVANHFHLAFSIRCDYSFMERAKLKDLKIIHPKKQMKV